MFVRERVTKIHLVFANEQMLARKSSLYQDFEGVLGNKVISELCVAVESKVDAVLKNQAILFDDADVALLDY